MEEAWLAVLVLGILEYYKQSKGRGQVYQCVVRLKYGLAAEWVSCMYVYEL